MRPRSATLVLCSGALGLALSACGDTGFEPGGRVDFDRDGFGAPVDCDDLDAAVNPDAEERCDGVDNDCDGLTDEDDAVDAVAFYADADGDGYGAAAYPRLACEAPAGHVATDDDCDDLDERVSPAAEERCNEVDDDCDGEVDEAAVDARVWYRDADGDDWGTDTETLAACADADPEGYVTRRGDCDDEDYFVNPDAEETWYDGVDADCDGADDDDADGDGFAWDGVGGEDCDDEEPRVNPDEDERCNDRDDDCDGLVDEAGSLGELEVWTDADGDGQGDPDTADVSCELDEGLVENDLDCDDGDASVYTGAPDTWYDGVDADCAGNSDYDADGDGYDAEEYGGGDCDDTSAAVVPTEYFPDLDGDGYGDRDAMVASCSPVAGYITTGGDCDDGESSVNPGASEVCGNGVDDDCDDTALGCSLEGSTTLDEAALFLAGVDSSDQAGTRMALGDLDGDGTEDLVVGGPEVLAASDAGFAWILSGPLSGSVDLDTGVTLEGSSAGDEFGLDLVTLDFDGDGYDDLLVGAPNLSASASTSGVVALFLGPVTASVGVGEADLLLSGVDTGDRAGRAVDAVADLDGDGLDELLLGAPAYDGGEYNSGGAFLFYGGLSADAQIDEAGAAILGEEFRGTLGSRVHAASDLDGDGLADLAVTELKGDGDDTDSGVVWLFSGPLSGSLGTGDADARLDGASNGDSFGASLATADLDGDGTDDLVVGATASDAGGASNTGAAWVFSGSLAASGDTGDAVAELVGSAANDQLGVALSAGGDFDSDGVADLVVGAARYDAGLSSTGGAFLFLGPVSGSLEAGEADGVITGVAADQDLGAALLWAHSLSGSGYDELLVGVPGATDGGSDAGGVALFTGGPGL